MDFLHRINDLLTYSLSAQPPGKTEKGESFRLYYDNPDVILLLSSCFSFSVGFFFFFFNCFFIIIALTSLCMVWTSSHYSSSISPTGTFNVNTLVSLFSLSN